MKCCYPIGLVLLLVLSACHSSQREARQMVRRAELLADTQPDSTARLIDSVLRMPVYFSERQRMEMALLQAEALFGDRGQEILPVMDDDFFDDKPTLTTSPELERAAAYYARKKQYTKAAHAALYSGFIQQHYNDKAAAMQSFKDAEHFSGIVRDSLTMARAEYQMGKMLVNNGLENEATNILQTANQGFGKHYADKALVQNVIANCYILLGDYENAEHHLQLCLEYADKECSSTIQTKALNNFAVLFRQKGEYNKALSFLNQAETIVDDEGKLVVFLNKATIFMAQKEIDSASYCFHYIEDSLLNTKIKAEIKASAYSAFSQFAASQGNYSEAYRYRGLYDHLLFNLMAEREQKSVYRIQQQYDYNVLKETMNKKVIQRQRIIMLLSILTALILLAFSKSQIRLARMRKQEAEANANLFHFMQQNKALVESNMAHKKEILDTTQQLSDLLNARLRAMQQLDYCLKTPKDKIALKDLEQEVFGSGDHWEAIKEVLVALYPGLWESLKLKYPEMDEMELRVSMLSHLKLSRLAESTLLGISTSVLDKLRTKVRKIMTEDKTL